MKQANTILSHLQTLPQFRILKSHYCYQKFLSLLSPKFQKAIAFIYVKEETLFVALSHPGFKMELNYNKELLKSVLALLAQEDEKCQNITASKVVLFNSRNHQFVKKESSYQSIPYYQEMALGDFSIQSEDKELLQAFENIRQSISKQQ